MASNLSESSISAALQSMSGTSPHLTWKLRGAVMLSNHWPRNSNNQSGNSNVNSACETYQLEKMKLSLIGTASW